MTIERWFLLSELAALPGGPNSVVATFYPREEGGNLAITISAPPEGLAARAVALAQRPGAHTVTIAPAAASSVSVRLADAFAEHLVTVRAHGPLRRTAVLTCPHRLEAPPGYVRLPHLVTVIDEQFGVEDRTVWELMPTAHVTAWLGQPLPDQEFFEEQLDGLARLRQLVRGDALPGTPAGRRLATVLGDHYLSIRFVYLHAELICEVLGDMKEHV